jgi:hypothetical protein
VYAKSANAKNAHTLLCKHKDIQYVYILEFRVLGFRVKGLGFRGGVMHCCKHVIADYVPHIPWIEDLLGTFLSFCPIV